ncbi:hypothetical protein OUZ56_004504 [Daphnia magna]|uniref:Secreted protein n=1 Tax=Daphnia magna TaxID=35525 RepID=A0ABQ9YQ88_9CRUS|nr:hypothetical protein OUZ56_004504 [Daphnia magna]
MLVSLLLFFAVLISGCCGGRYRISSLWISYCLVLWTSRLSPRRRSIPAGHARLALSLLWPVRSLNNNLVMYPDLCNP